MNEIYFIPTPIGNIEDISQRIINTLKSVDFIVCEDTRVIGKLFKYLGIEKKTFISYNDHNKIKRTEQIVERVLNNEKCGFVSDAGMPAISDPGYYLIREAIKNNIKIIPIPGPSAVLIALIGSGLPTNAFSFYGFLPKKKNKRKLFLQNIMNRKETTIVFESPYRIDKTLNEIYEIDENRNIVIARELTKTYEEFIRGNVKEVLEKKWNRKGEIVLLIQGDKNDT